MHNDGSFDVVVVGGGIVGAATFYKLQKRFPERTMLLIDKMPRLADHQTGNNSGVIHSGLYYKPGSLKATNCVQGRRELVPFCKEHGVPLIKVKDSKTLGEWVGLCKYNAPTNEAESVMSCSYAVVKRWGEETEARHVLMKYIKSQS